MPFDRKSFFSSFCMFRQGAIGEPKSLDGTILINEVNDPTRIQRIKSKVIYRNRNAGSDLYRGIRPIKAQPWHVEHLPCANRLLRPLPRDLASAKLDAIVVYVVPDWHSNS
jgi:hypothetical protein